MARMIPRGKVEVNATISRQLVRLDRLQEEQSSTLIFLLDLNIPASSSGLPSFHVLQMSPTISLLHIPFTPHSNFAFVKARIVTERFGVFIGKHMQPKELPIAFDVDKGVTCPMP